MSLKTLEMLKLSFLCMTTQTWRLPYSVCSIKLWEWHHIKWEFHPGCHTCTSSMASTSRRRCWAFFFFKKIYFNAYQWRWDWAATGEHDELQIRLSCWVKLERHWKLRSNLSELCGQQKHQEVQCSVFLFWSCQSTYLKFLWKPHVKTLFSSPMSNLHSTKKCKMIKYAQKFKIKILAHYWCFICATKRTKGRYKV